MMKQLGWILIAPLAASWVAACSSNPAVDIGDPVGCCADGLCGQLGWLRRGLPVRRTVPIASAWSSTATGPGTLRVGNAALLPPATDPNVAYPAGRDSGHHEVSYDRRGRRRGIRVPRPRHPDSGQPNSDRRRPQRISTQAGALLQTPVRDDFNGGSYGCVGELGIQHARAWLHLYADEPHRRRRPFP